MTSKLIAMVACVVMSAYFSATETAFSSLNRTRLKAMAENGSKKAELSLKLAENYDQLISTILIGNNIVNIGVASLGTLVFTDLLGKELGAAVSTAVITIVVLIFGEITPKSLAKDYPEKFAMFSAPIIHGILLVLTPLNYIFTQWKKLVNRLFHASQDSRMSQEELLILLDEVQQEGAIDEDGGTLLKNAVEFGELEAQDILTHRVDLDVLSIDATREETARMFDETRHTRLPIYEGSIDKIVGILHQKDFYRGGTVRPEPLRELMTPPIFTHQTEKVSDLLQTLRNEKSHIAVVVDEYGGTLGIVTMEDILEELVGEIWDEHDDVEEPIQKLEDGTFLVDGGASMGDFCDQFLVDTDSESVSVGGWVMEAMDCIPQVGQSFVFNNLEITVKEVADHRVEAVQVRVHDPEQFDEQ